MPLHDKPTLLAAFTWATVQDLALADGRVTRGELRAFEEAARAAREAGLLSADGQVLPGFDEILAEARRSLRFMLDTEEKAELFARLRAAAAIDGEIDPQEEELIAGVAAAIEEDQ